MIPIGDDNVIGGSKPYFSYGLILVNVIIFLIQVTTPGSLICDYATIPNDIANGKGYYTILTSMFLHGGWMHLAGNMLFIWIFADNVEATIGNLQFIIFYLLGGVAGSFGHLFFDGSAAEILQNCCMVCPALNACETACPGSIPSLGASGAISAVLGAYLVMYPKSKIKIWAFIMMLRWPAWVFLGLWFGEQMVSGLGSLGPSTTSGVAWWAHIGGFVFGLAGGFLFKSKAKYRTTGIEYDDHTV